MRWPRDTVYPQELAVTSPTSGGRSAGKIPSRTQAKEFFFPAIAYCLRHYATSRKVAGQRPDKVNKFFSIYLIIPTALGPEIYSASNRNEYQKQKANSGE
jgi:hypothetical protein